MSQQEDVKSLLEAGAHFGHRTSRWNPKMRPYIYTERGGIYIIDLVQTAERMREAAEFAKSTTAAGKQILFTGTKKHIAPTIQQVAGDAGMPYVIDRWFGGILTNFDTILRRIRYFRKLTQQLESGELNETYNKREITKFQEERDKMAISFTGLADMEELPGALFVSDVNNEKTAVREANRLGIPVIALVDSNSDPGPIDYAIPANDDAVKTVSLIAGTIAEAAAAGAKEHASAASKTKSSKSSDASKAKSGQSGTKKKATQAENSDSATETESSEAGQTSQQADTSSHDKDNTSASGSTSRKRTTKTTSKATSSNANEQPQEEAS